MNNCGGCVMKKYLTINENWQNFVKQHKKLSQQIADIFWQEANKYQPALSAMEIANVDVFLNSVNIAVTKFKRRYTTKIHETINNIYAKILMELFININPQQAPKYIRQAKYFVIILFSGTSARILYFPTATSYNESPNYITWQKDQFYAGDNYNEALKTLMHNNSIMQDLIKIF